MKTNFSKDVRNVFSLALDLARDECDLQTEEGKMMKKRDMENYLRDKINKDILGGKTLYQAVRRNNTLIYEITEEIVNVALGEDVINSPFMNEFVETRNRALGEVGSFYSEGGLLTVSSFAGNHWDTNRQLLDVGESFTLPKEWLYIHVYEDLERFLLGITTLDKLMDKIYKSFNKYIQDRIYACFQNVATAVPAEFSKTGNSEEAVGELVDLVQAAGGYDSITIAGTKGALRTLAGIVPDKTFAETQKEAKAMNGSIGNWEGNKLMVIPQTLKSGTFETALGNKKLFILGTDVEPIKLDVYGDTRTSMDTEGTRRNDMSVDIQIQTAVGFGIVMPAYFGVFTFA